MTDELFIHIAGKTRTDKCPETTGNTCPTCGSELEGEYGFCDRYGLGGFMRCQNQECLNVYNFTEDKG